MTTPTPGSLRLLLVDDHAVVRAGYRRLLEQAGPSWIVSEAVSGEDACQQYAQAGHDVVVMDLSLPGIGGLEALRRIVQRNRGARVVIFSMHDQAVFAEQALATGALGYITKSSAPDVLIEAVTAVAAGQRYLSAEIQAALAETGIPPVSLAVLSPREFEIFRLLAEGRPPTSIGGMLNISYKTVANHSVSIREKLKLQTAAELTRFAIREGVIQL